MKLAWAAALLIGLLAATPSWAQLAPIGPGGGPGGGGGGGGGAPSGPAGGDLSGTYPNPSVVSFNGGTPFGTAASANTGTSGATIPLLNGTNTWSGAQAFNAGLTGTTGAFSGLLGTSAAGTAANPELYVGNATTGLYSVSTTGLGLSVNGTLVLDYGITTGGRVTSLVTFGFTNAQAANGGSIKLAGGNTALTSSSAALLQLGTADAASPVAQTLQVQSVVAGTANTAAVNWTQQASLSTGTGTAGLLNINTGFASLSENATITATNASPGVITYTAHGLVPGASGQFSNSGGALPTGISAVTTYFVCKDANYTVNTFDISLTWTNGACGTLINTSSTGSGTNTFTTNTTVQNAASAVVAIGPSGLTGSQNIPALSISQVWNTSAVVDAALLVNVTNIASGAASKIFDVQLAGTTQFYVDKSGNAVAAGQLVTGNNLGTTNNASTIFFRNGGTSLFSPASNKLQIGAADAASPAAQTLLVQNVVAGNANTAAATWTLQGSLSNGSGGGGNIVISTTQSIAASGTQNTALAAVTIIGGTQVVQINQIATDATHTDTTVCQDTTTHGLYFGSGTAGICLGNVSSIRFKPDYALIADGLGVINALDPGLYHYGQGMVSGDDGKLKVGFTAERYAAVLPQFTRYDAEGRPNGLDMMAAFPFAVRAIQQIDTGKADKTEVAEMQTRIDALTKRVAELEHPGSRGATIDVCYLTDPVQCPLVTVTNNAVHAPSNMETLH